MKAGWALAKIGDLLTIQNGFAFDSKRFSDSKGVPLIRIRDLKDGRETETKYSGSFEKRYEVKAGDFLIGMDGEFGCYEWRGGKALLNQRVCRLQAFSERLEPKFLYYGINKHLKEIEDATTYTTVKHLSSKQISNIEIPLPALPEQQRIVAVLDEAFAGLATATENTDKNLKNARELFESYLSSVFSADSDLTSLASLALEITDGDHMPPPKSKDGVPFITISNINKSTYEIDFSNTFKVPKSYYDALKDNRKPKEGDVLYTVTGSFGISVAVKAASKFCFQRHIGLVRPRPEVDSKWMWYALRSRLAFDQAAAGATGTAQKTVSLKVLRSIQLPLMPPAVQKAVTAKLDNLSEVTQQLEERYLRKLDALADLKQSLLQKAFSGELTSPASSTIKEAAA